MSRFSDYDCDVTADAQAAYTSHVREQYRTPEMRAKLLAFKAFLEAMPVREIIADRFYRPESGGMCAIAAFVKSTGASDETLCGIDRMSTEEREEHDGYEEPGDEATVWAGVHAGLSCEIATDLGWKNDEVWTRVCIGFRERRPGVHLPFDHPQHGIVWKRAPEFESVFRAMTDAERWQRLHGFVTAVTAEPVPHETVDG